MQIVLTGRNQVEMGDTSKSVPVLMEDFVDCNHAMVLKIGFEGHSVVVNVMELWAAINGLYELQRLTMLSNITVCNIEG